MHLFQCISDTSRHRPLSHKLDLSSFDPDWALPLALLADCFKRRLEWSWSTDTAADLTEAEKLARQAMAVDSTDAQALAFAGS